MTVPFAKHDLIEITYDGHTNDGVVIMASTNGKSLVVGFDAIIDGHVGMMPIVMEDGVSGHSLISGAEIIIKRKETDERAS
jgi:hypothetical protein